MTRVWQAARADELESLWLAVFTHLQARVTACARLCGDGAVLLGLECGQQRACAQLRARVRLCLHRALYVDDTRALTARYSRLFRCTASV
jgi:hypothetical protein